MQLYCSLLPRCGNQCFPPTASHFSHFNCLVSLAPRTISVTNALLQKAPLPFHEQWQVAVDPVNVDFVFSGFAQQGDAGVNNGMNGGIGSNSGSGNGSGSINRNDSPASSFGGGVSDAANMDDATRRIRAVFAAAGPSASSASASSASSSSPSSPSSSSGGGASDTRTQLRLIALPAFECTVW